MLLLELLLYLEGRRCFNRTDVNEVPNPANVRFTPESGPFGQA